MDGSQFDALSRALAAAHSRRGLTGLLGGLLVGGSLPLLYAAEGAAKRKKAAPKKAKKAKAKPKKKVKAKSKKATKKSKKRAKKKAKK